MAQSEMDYVAVKPCGCVGALASADYDKRELAKDLARWLRHGCSVERMTTEEAREKFGCDCPVCRPAAPAPVQEAMAL